MNDKLDTMSMNIYMTRGDEMDSFYRNGMSFGLNM